ncbi:hypothetical protein LA080_014248 [Diaporthe eres]|nr:hypothetical protein LA080_014248 [Diaporthe eres]
MEKLGGHRTLEQNEIKWEGNDVILRWKSMAINGNEDQSVQHTCFNVVKEAVASQAGFRFDVLVGVDHGLPIQNQTRGLGPEEASSADSSVIDRTDDLPAHSFEDSRSVDLRPLPVTYCSPQPATATLSFSGPNPGVEMASFFNNFRNGRDVEFKAVESSAGRLFESQRPGSGKRKSSYSDNSGCPSRKSRSFEGSARR